MSTELENVDRMEVDPDSVPNEPVRSVEGWIVLVTNLHEETSEEDLQDRFADFGAIKNLHLNLDRRTGYVKGYAFLEYARKEEATAAIEEVNDSDLLGNKVSVAFAFVTPPVAADKKQNGKVERERSRSPERRG